jgi:hypothetical protein
LKFRIYASPQFSPALQLQDWGLYNDIVISSLESESVM